MSYNGDGYLINTPEGTRDVLWDDCKSARGIETALVALFSRQGYREVRTPVLEYYDLFMRARNPISPDSMVKLVGRDGGLLVLRPDCTTPIARIVATRLEDMPQRLFYCQSVFRLAANSRGENCETAQCGVELFGIPGFEGDAEIVALAVDALTALGADSFCLELGGLPQSELEAIRESLGETRASYVRFEPELHQDIDYYTGLVFRAYAPGTGKAILAGGRYDKLTGDFGRDVPAVGFAVYVDEVRKLHDAPRANSRVRIAVAKGRVLSDFAALVAKLGFAIDSALDDRKLVRDIPNSNLSLVLAKSADVITYVEHGVCELGVVGRDTILELGGDFTELLDLKFGECRFALAGPSGLSPDAVHVAASKYPNVAREYFTALGSNVDIIKIDGSVELAPILGLADAIVDLVQTGGTLKANGLEVLDEISRITGRLIANKAALRLRKPELAELTDRLRLALG
ncbi:MAG: ATP phosphoribosyltransferase [Oscillospiraceae bacterium]|jgi:ATP phosphoribosyltransferase|nr:ATP phosphoribosyltransferase [Oscillospiraceae bacterium]